MNKETKKKWLRALRSGKYKQGKGVLRKDMPKKMGAETTFCCLGVLCDIVDSSRWPERKGRGKENRTMWGDSPSLTLPKDVEFATGVTPYQAGSLASMNDGGSTFEEIAKYIEEKL